MVNLKFYLNAIFQKEQVISEFLERRELPEVKTREEVTTTFLTQAYKGPD